jgi:hypothetical protein
MYEMRAPTPETVSSLRAPVAGQKKGDAAHFRGREKSCVPFLLPSWPGAVRGAKEELANQRDSSVGKEWLTLCNRNFMQVKKIRAETL